jgi:transposase InsO family protein
VNHDDPAFGYRFIADELERLGHRAPESRVWRLCSEQRLWSAHSKKRGLHRRPAPPVHYDLVERDFTADAPNELTDITEHRTREGKLNCCVVKNVFSSRIVGYATDARMTSQLAVRALHCRRFLNLPTCDREWGVSEIGGTITPSHFEDRVPQSSTATGDQFRSHGYVRTLARFELRGSMGRVAACADNSAMESFWSTMQIELLNRQRWKTRVELANAMFDYIEIFYNRRRRHSQLDYRSPIEFEVASDKQLIIA